MKISRLGTLLAAGLLCFPGVAPVTSVPHVARVLLISIDGLHPVDLDRFVAAHPGSTLARFTSRGLTYEHARTVAPSDSFPGLLAATTGGHPATTGVYYDDSYDGSLYPAGSACAGPAGADVVYTEAADVDPARPDGGGLDRGKLPLAKRGQACEAVYPHAYLRVDTIFEVVRAAGGRTAWCDKHPVYEMLNGPSGTGVEDLFTPEIAAAPNTLAGIEADDETKAAAVVREIRGFDHTGARPAPVPELFGTNFQALSWAQKDARGGYVDAAATPSAEVAAALDAIDASLGRIDAALAAAGFDDSTMVVIAAKHGQAPIDPGLRRIVDANRLRALVPGLADATTDDGALVWLRDGRRAFRDAAARALDANRGELGIARIFDGGHAPAGFGVAPGDPRAPDLIVQTQPGVIYAKPSATKRAEHGGLSDDDRDVALLVVEPGARPGRVRTPVETTAIAPAILDALGLDPMRLQAVARERTPSLPGLGERGG